MAINSDVIKGTGVALEQEAYKTFGAAVENQVDGLLGKVLGQKAYQTDPNSAAYAARNFAPGGKETAVWSPTKYAAGLIGKYYPKNKFLFRVKIQFNSNVLDRLSSFGFNPSDISEFTYVVKSIDLPTVTFEYEEVNMYNFKTKILKGIEHNDLQLALYDDSANIAISSIISYLQLLSPITRNSHRTETPPSFFQDGAMNFTNDYRGNDKTGSRDVLPNNTADPIAYLVVEQYFAPGIGANEPALKSNSFTFANPKITRFDISDQNYEDGSSANIVTLAFNYDSLHMETKSNMSSITDTVIGPGNPIGDLFGNSNDGYYSGGFGAPNRMAAGKAKNPFIDIIQNQGRRAADNAVRNVLNKTLGPDAGRALGDVYSKVGGAVGAAVGKTLKGASESVIQNVASPTPPPVKDNTTPESLPGFDANI